MVCFRDGRLIYGIQRKKKREGTDDGTKKKKKKIRKEIKTEDASPADLSETRYLKYDYHKTKVQPPCCSRGNVCVTKLGIAVISSQ